MTSKEIKDKIDTEMKSASTMLVNFTTQGGYVGHMYMPFVPRIGESFLMPSSSAFDGRERFLRIVEVLYEPELGSVRVHGHPMTVQAKNQLTP